MPQPARSEIGSCLLGELPNALDGEDFARDVGEYGRGIAGPGADLEHLLAAVQASASIMKATIKGCDMVCPEPIGCGVSA